MIVFHHSFTYLDARSSALGSVERAVRWTIDNARFGVPMFFVISGYCIAATSDSQRRRRRAGSHFFRRRFRRIFPPYWIYLALTTTTAGLTAWAGYPLLFGDENYPIARPGDLTASQWLGNLTLTETWRHHLGGEPSRFVAGHVWTLCYEEQFYLICGLVVSAVPARLFPGLAVVTAACLLMLLSRIAPKGTFLDGHWMLFAEGVLVYWWCVHARGRSRSIAVLLLMAMMLIVVLRKTPDWWGWTAFVSGPAYALVLIGLRRWDGLISGSRSLRPLGWCGAVCYSLYLVHMPVTKAVSHLLALRGLHDLSSSLTIVMPLAVGSSLAFGWGFHLLVERRFLNPPQ